MGGNDQIPYYKSTIRSFSKIISTFMVSHNQAQFLFFHFSLLISKFESLFLSAFFLIVLIFVMILHESKMWHVKYEEINNDWDCSNQMTKVILSLAVGSTGQSSLTCTGVLTWKKIILSKLKSNKLEYIYVVIVSVCTLHCNTESSILSVLSIVNIVLWM